MGLAVKSDESGKDCCNNWQSIQKAFVIIVHRSLRFQYLLYTCYYDQSTVCSCFQVGPLSNSTHTQCLCNHMSSFASSFFTPPNKIDLSKVNLTELFNNPTVTIIVCGIFLLYFLLLVWARRADKRDLQLVRVG